MIFIKKKDKKKTEKPIILENCTDSFTFLCIKTVELRCVTPGLEFYWSHWEIPTGEGGESVNKYMNNILFSTLQCVS